MENTEAFKGIFMIPVIFWQVFCIFKILLEVTQFSRALSWFQWWYDNVSVLPTSTNGNYRGFQVCFHESSDSWTRSLHYQLTLLEVVGVFMMLVTVWQGFCITIKENNNEYPTYSLCGLWKQHSQENKASYSTGASGLRKTVYRQQNLHNITW